MRTAFAFAVALAASMASAGVVITPIRANQVVAKDSNDCFFGVTTPNGCGSSIMINSQDVIADCDGVVHRMDSTMVGRKLIAIARAEFLEDEPAPTPCKHTAFGAVIQLTGEGSCGQH